MCLLPPGEYYKDLLAPLGEVTVAMEENGVPLDLPAAEALLGTVQNHEAATQAELADWAARTGWAGEAPNWGSWQQLQRFVYDHLGLKPSPYWKKGQTGYDEDGEVIDGFYGDPALKTDDKALEWLGARYPEAAGLETVRRLRWVQRARSYLEKWTTLALRHPGPHGQDWWWLHPSFGLASDLDTRPGAVTGRFAVKNPALQQTPQDPDPRKAGTYDYFLRRLFRAPPGYAVVVIDYSQLELVVLAHICHRLFGTTGLVERLQPGAPDMHSATAKYVFGDVLGNERLRLLPVDRIKKEAKEERDIVKPIRYGLNYGKGPVGFGWTLFLADGSPLGVERAEQIIQALLDFDPEIREYQGWVRRFIEEQGGIASLLGRWLPLPDATAYSKGLRNRAWRRALNYPMQAGGQEVTAAAMIRAQASRRLRDLGFRLFLQVHDELCGLVPIENAEEAQAVLNDIMITTFELDAHLGAAGGIGPSWGEAKA